MKSNSRARKKGAPPRMSAERELQIIGELDAWKRGQRPGRLSWKKLEDVSSFSRQTLATKPAIVELYRSIKESQTLGRKIKKPQTDDERAASLNAEIAHLRRTLDKYDERFARIAYWTAAAGLDLNELVRALPQRNREAEHRRAGRRRQT